MFHFFQRRPGIWCLRFLSCMKSLILIMPNLNSLVPDSNVYARFEECITETPFRKSSQSIQAKWHCMIWRICTTVRESLPTYRFVTKEETEECNLGWVWEDKWLFNSISRLEGILRKDCTTSSVWTGTFLGHLKTSRALVILTETYLGNEGDKS